MKTFLSVLVLSMLMLTESFAQVSVEFQGETTKIWDKNIMRGCVNTKFQMNSWKSNDTLFVIERDPYPLTTCGICYYNLCTSFIGLTPGKYFVVVKHQFAMTLTKDTTTIAGTLTFTISSPPIATSNTNYYQSNCISSPQSVVEDKTVPNAFATISIFPNPFNSSTIIRYFIPTGREISLTIFNMAGEQVDFLTTEEKQAGYHEFNYSATNLSSGPYVCRLKYGNESVSVKLLLLK